MIKSLLAKPLSALLWLLAGLGPAQAALGFDITGIKWPNGQTDFYVQIDGLSPSGLSWNAAYLDAIKEWNVNTDFNIVVRNAYRDPCNSEGVSGVDFTDTVCGSEYGKSTLAVTIRKFQSEILGPPSLVEADVVFNTGVDYDIYDGNIVQPGVTGIDFRRVALHELGHVIGLDHESQEPAIMAPNIGNIDRLREDDILGVNTLYGGLASCEISALRFGPQQDSLRAGDCTVDQLTSGEGDSSFIDLYQFTLSAPSTLRFTMSSPTLDSVLLLADANLNFLEADDLAFQLCNSTLETSLQPGTYYLLANTFNSPVKQECTNTGGYTLDTTVISSEFLTLGASSSLLGDVSSATFAGGITANNGLTYSNRFPPTAALDITGQLSIDPTHVGEAGFLVVAGVIEGEILLLNSMGQFVDYDPAGPLIRAQVTLLQETEVVVAAEGLVPRAIGVEDIEVDFLFGYGLLSEPEELYFHRSPLTLIVDPDL